MVQTVTDRVAFPRLTENEMACIAEMGALRRFAPGEQLVEKGARNFSFFAIQSGSVTVLEKSSGRPREVVTHGPGEFTGDVDVLTGRPSVVSIVAAEPTEAYEITHCRMRRLLGEIPNLSDKLLNAFQLRRELLEESGFMGVRVVGPENSPETLRIREFFYKNRVPHTFQDSDGPTGQEWLREFGADEADTPVIRCGEHTARKPSLARIAECLGISREVDNKLFDLVIVGAGPSGLAAAVYAASEGLKTLVLDRVGPGGQAGGSSRIENYMGFPAGLSGTDLANRGYLQALKFGAQFSAPVSVKSVCDGEEPGLRCLELCTGQRVLARAALIATGVSYRRLPVEGCGRFEAAGLYYTATSVESRVCREATAIVVGGGNSAGQAAMYLAEHASEVKIVIRGVDLGKSMSSYLCERIYKAPNIEVLKCAEVVAVAGDERLSSVTLRDNRTGETREIACAGLFSFIGAKPHTEWLGDRVALDERGFVLTGPAVQQHPAWTLDRAPCELETSLPGVFAAGDARAGTTKRCAFAVGDGALAVTCIHQHLARQA